MTITRENLFQISEKNSILRKRKIAFWNKQKWVNKELITWSGLARQLDEPAFCEKMGKNDKFHSQNISDHMEIS